MSFFTINNWLEILVIVVLVAMTLYGHYRGLLRLMVSVTALFLTVLLVQMISPHTTNILIKNQFLQNTITKQINRKLSIEDSGEDHYEKVAQQRTAIEELNLPAQMKELLIENNNNEVYELLGIEHFADYISNILVRMVFNAIGFILTFIIIFVITRFVLKVLNIVTKIPIVSGLNKIAGALVGFLQGIILLWIFFLLLSLFTETKTGEIIIQQIRKSQWLFFLYNSNIFTKLILAAVKKML